MLWQRRLVTLGIGLLAAVSLIPLHPVTGAPGRSLTRDQPTPDQTQTVASRPLAAEPGIQVDSGHNAYIVASRGVPRDRGLDRATGSPGAGRSGPVVAGTSLPEAIAP